jgi:hypothetical protein
VGRYVPGEPSLYSRGIGKVARGLSLIEVLVVNSHIAMTTEGAWTAGCRYSGGADLFSLLLFFAGGHVLFVCDWVDARLGRSVSNQSGGEAVDLSALQGQVPPAERRQGGVQLTGWVALAWSFWGRSRGPAGSPA